MNRDRQGLIYDPAVSPLNVAIVGLGNLGSHAAVALARLGASSLELHDFDVIEEHNLSSQSYNAADIGKRKTEAVRQQIAAIDPSIPCSELARFASTTCPLIVCGVDSLEARREIAELLISLNWEGTILDGRMGGEQIEL